MAIDHVRKRMRRQKAGQAIEIEKSGLFAAENVEVEAAQHFVRADLHKALAGLRTEERAVLEMAYFQGMTLREVAIALEMPLGTVKTRLHTGLSRMRIELAEWKLEVLG